MNKDIFCKGYTWGFFSKRGDFQTEAAEKSMERLASNGLNWERFRNRILYTLNEDTTFYYTSIKKDGK